MFRVLRYRVGDLGWMGGGDANTVFLPHHPSDREAVAEPHRPLRGGPRPGEIERLGDDLAAALDRGTRSTIIRSDCGKDPRGSNFRKKCTGGRPNCRHGSSESGSCTIPIAGLEPCSTASI